MKLSVLDLGLFFFFSFAWSQGQQTGEKEQEIRDVKRTIEAALHRLEALEGAQEQKPADEKAKPLSWTDFVKLYGDFRFRHEVIDTDALDTQHRGRIRARLGLEAEVNEEVDLNFRVTTNQGGDPISHNQSLDGGFSKKDVFFDLAYFDWHPCSDSHLQGGKVNVPFFKPGESQLIWDNDLTPEGAAFLWSGEMEGASAFLNAGAFWVEERSQAADSFLWGAQGGMKVKVADDDSVVFGAGLFDYANVKGNSPFFAASGLGNTLAGGLYAKEYRELELFLEYHCTIEGRPLKVYGDYVNNAATGSADHGWLVGTRLGKLKDPGDWAFRWDYRVLEADAVIGDFTDSDPWGGGTDGRGHVLAAETQIAKRWTGGATWSHTENTLGNTTDYDRLQLDLVFKF